jgi:hypothetical protein
MKKPKPKKKSEQPHAGQYDSGRARDFVREAYQKSGGATPELKRVYNSFLENERKRERARLDTADRMRKLSGGSLPEDWDGDPLNDVCKEAKEFLADLSVMKD